MDRILLNLPRSNNTHIKNIFDGIFLSPPFILAFCSTGILSSLVPVQTGLFYPSFVSLRYSTTVQDRLCILSRKSRFMVAFWPPLSIRSSPSFGFSVLILFATRIIFPFPPLYVEVQRMWVVDDREGRDDAFSNIIWFKERENVRFSIIFRSRLDSKIVRCSIFQYMKSNMRMRRIKTKICIGLFKVKKQQTCHKDCRDVLSVDVPHGFYTSWKKKRVCN